MTIWIDAQISPAISIWIKNTFSVEAFPVRDLKLLDASDEDIFHAARKSNAIVMTKDKDFCSLLERFGPPPNIIWVTCGNTSNMQLTSILLKTLQ